MVLVPILLAPARLLQTYLSFKPDPQIVLWRPIFLPSPSVAAATCQSLKMWAGQLAAKEVTTYAVEMLARRPEKGGRRPLRLAVKLAPAKVESHRGVRLSSIGLPRRCRCQFRPNGENPKSPTRSICTSGTHSRG